MRITLVCGLRGCGKSTYVKEHLTDGALAYDMDAIASAFRLRMPHEEYHEAARHMANDMLFGWLDNAERYTDEVYVIRTAPRLREVARINPDRVVICQTRYVVREMDDPDAAAERLEHLRMYCFHNDVPCVVL